MTDPRDEEIARLREALADLVEMTADLWSDWETEMNGTPHPWPEPTPLTRARDVLQSGTDVTPDETRARPGAEDSA